MVSPMASAMRSMEDKRGSRRQPKVEGMKESMREG